MKKIYSSFLTLFILSYSFFVVDYFPQSNNALNFSNSNFLQHGDFVYIEAPNYSFTDKLSVCAWVKWKVDPSSQPLITGHEGEGRWANLVTIDKHNGLDQGQFWLQHSSGNQKFEWAVTASSRQYVQSVTVPSINKWVYLVGVYDGSALTTMRFYINGVEEGSKSQTSINGNIAAFNSDHRLNFARIPSGYRLFTGELDEVRIYKRALTQDEIRAQMFSKNTINSADLVSYWSLDETIGTTVNDEGSMNFDGTFYSALVDVHSPLISPPPFQIKDSDKSWVVDEWANKTIKTVAGAGVDETNTVSSNTSNTLTLQNPWIITPIIDGQPNMTWYGIQNPNETSQWANSLSPISLYCAFINSNAPTTIGNNSEFSASITSLPNSSNNLSLYQLGSSNGSPYSTGETFPSGITKRSNIIWGVNEWGSVTADLLFNYSSIPGITNPASIKLLRRLRDVSPIVWTEVTLSSRDDIAKTFTLIGQTDFYEYALGSDNSNSLPVELSSFSAAVIGKDVKLSWNTATERNNYGFEIERSVISNGVRNLNWEKIGFVNGNGNSNSPKSYSFIDDKVSAGKYSYRLKQIDNDGQYEYSKTIEVDVNGVKEYKLTQNYPNPFNPTTTIQYILPQAGNVKLTLYNILGQEIRTIVNEMKEAGTHTININASDLNSGMYIYKIESGSFVQTRKMTLVK